MPRKVKVKETVSNENLSIHQFYMEILNSIPSIVYWIDTNCALKGCNNAFVQWLGLKSMSDFAGSPYDQMLKFEKCSAQRAETFKLDDMAVLFSGEAKHNVEEPAVCDKENQTSYYLSNRVPIFDQDKHVKGLIVVLTDVTAQKNPEIKNPQENFTHHTANDMPNVLMVEDNFIAQKVEKELLTALNCHVEIASTGEKAVDLFHPGKYDLVFLDISMQDTSGYLVAKKIREKEQNTNFHVPIIALTSYQADVVQYDSEEYFMDGALSKPLTSEQAKQIIQHYYYHENIPIGGLKGGGKDRPPAKS